MSRAIITRILNLLGTLLVLLIGGLAYFLPLNSDHLPFGQASEQNPLDSNGLLSLVWLPIYLLMILFTLYQLLPMTHQYDYINHGIVPYYFVICLCNCGWLLSVTYPLPQAPWLPLVFVYPMTLALVFVYFGSLRYIIRDLKKEEDSDDHYYLNYFFGRSWIGMSLSWSILLSLCQSFLILPQISHAANLIYFAIAYACYGLISVLVVLFNRDALFGLTTVWCSICLGIINQRDFDGWVFNSQLPVFISAISVGAVVLFCSLAMLVRNCLLIKDRREHKRINHSEYFPDDKA